MNYQLLWALGLRPVAFQRVYIAIVFLIPIPGFFFLRELNILGRVGRILATIVWPVALGLAVLTLFVGPQSSLRAVNSTFVVAVFVVLLIALVRVGPGSPDITLIRRGLFLFAVGVLYDNITTIVGHYHNIEPFCFIPLLASLGIVAGRRTLVNEQELKVIRKELEIAQRIQSSILPSSFPTSKSFCVAACYSPMSSVAGDFYDFILANDHEAGLLIADVSGHGVPAALIASMVKLAATTHRVDADNPSRLLDGLNATLLRQYPQPVCDGSLCLPECSHAGAALLRRCASANAPSSQGRDQRNHRERPYARRFPFRYLHHRHSPHPVRRSPRALHGRIARGHKRS
jgi:phosphoserine phosphatase RsbU/P